MGTRSHCPSQDPEPRSSAASPLPLPLCSRGPEIPGEGPLVSILPVPHSLRGHRPPKCACHEGRLDIRVCVPGREACCPGHWSRIWKDIAICCPGQVDRAGPAGGHLGRHAEMQSSKVAKPGSGRAGRSAQAAADVGAGAMTQKPAEPGVLPCVSCRLGAPSGLLSCLWPAALSLRSLHHIFPPVLKPWGPSLALPEPGSSGAWPSRWLVPGQL